jgi:hypothetical protein
MSRAASEKRLKKIRVDFASNGGVVVSHHFHPSNGFGRPAPEKHAFGDYGGAHQYLSSLKH